jgi:hypothetical protein
MRLRFPVVLFALLSSAAGGFAQHLVVTAEGHHGAAPPIVMQDDLTAEVNKKPASIEKWIPLRGEQAALQLYIVIDDGSDTDLGLQFPSLKNFINAQPASTEIGLAYLRNGAAEIVAPPASDRTQLEKKLRIPLGEAGIAASPYMGISDLAKKWPAVDARREVLLITSGVDPWSPADPQNPYLEAAIEDSQRAGILVHSIYFGAAGHMGHSYWQSSWGRNYLSELGDGTGGEAYWQGFGSPVSFDPYLKDLAERLSNQYLLTLSAQDSKKGLQPVRVRAGNPKVSLMSASKIELKK